MPIPNWMIDWQKTYAEFDTGERRQCPNCGGEVDAINMYEKSESGLYSLMPQPCGCRLGLWSRAPQWAKEAGIVNLIPLD